jgi:hypothetical protein
MIKKRRIEQMKATEINKLKQAEAQRFKDEDERRREIERYVIAYETINRIFIQQCHISLAIMAEWLCCLSLTTKVLCSNLGTTRHRMTLDKSLTVVCLGSP